MGKLPLLLDDFEKAVNQLSSALASSPISDLEKAGCIQYFEFCFELAWKCIKEYSSQEGLPECLSPKICLKQAFTQGWIDNELVWLDMLKSRNQMSHTYDAREALTIFSSLPAYLSELLKLNENLRKGNG